MELIIRPAQAFGKSAVALRMEPGKGSIGYPAAWGIKRAVSSFFNSGTRPLQKALCSYNFGFRNAPFFAQAIPPASATFDTDDTGRAGGRLGMSSTTRPHI